uniref:Uncharacterized protein n=2 Tax=Gasterosteus aculeatus TaxID=69293 RepID=G3N7Y2_GASAC
MSVIEDIDLRPTDVADDDDEVSGTHLDEEEILGSSLDEHRWEDSVEETSNEDQEEQEVGSIMAQEEEPRQEEVSFFSLVSRGKQSHSEGKLQEALSFFLRAVDLKPGDPEVQLMTIQLYRRLSERS